MFIEIKNSFFTWTLFLHTQLCKSSHTHNFSPHFQNLEGDHKTDLFTSLNTFATQPLPPPTFWVVSLGLGVSLAKVSHIVNIGMITNLSETAHVCVLHLVNCRGRCTWGQKIEILSGQQKSLFCVQINHIWRNNNFWFHGFFSNFGY